MRGRNDFFRKTLSPALNFLPGLLILLFGMLALHSSLRALNEHTRLLNFYQERSEEITDLQDLHRPDRLRFYEDQMYWSVLALGLCGFVLAVLNGRKLGTLRDLNREKKEALLLLQNRLAAMESTFDAIGIVDGQGNLSYMNRALMDLHGLSGEKALRRIGQNWLFLYDGQGRKHIREKALPELRENGHWRGETSILREDGKFVPAELSLTQLPDGGFIGTARDMTEHKKAAEEKEQMQSQFYQAQKMEAIGRLAGGIAHDFNNILAAIDGYAGFLTEDLDENTAEAGFARNILKASAQARGLIDQILAFSRRHDEGDGLVNMKDALQESLSMIRASVPKTIEIRTEMNADSVLVRGNVSQISQVIMNLCVNACDAMENGHGCLTLGLRIVSPRDYRSLDFVKEGGDLSEEVPALQIHDIGPGRVRILAGGLDPECPEYACLYVRDTGCGMSRAVVEHVFEPFFTTKPVDRGTGLGLSTVHGVVLAHRGAISLETALDEGSLFEIFFPLARENEIPESILKSPAFPKSGGGRILLVEDQGTVAGVMIGILERMGHQVSHCVTGQKGLEAVRAQPERFDLVITDQNMPGMTGLEMIGIIHAEHPRIPFLLISGYSPERLEDMAARQPAIKGVLKKPISREALGQYIETILSAAQAEQRAA
ncbi:MAG: response regulator [Alphaproteobacteria bacterium]|nr:response regulator [Alphaproteobacteria bacterium]